ncbi:MAG: tetratricopeptide repeat protein [Candidatus Omnitrophota bacterium]|nr:tetratricopeptide repeat protein [Candidatus Omnitrophota bacterium]
MNKASLPKFLITAVAILCVLFCCQTVFAGMNLFSSSAKENPDELKMQANQYRQLGLEKQHMGNLAEAMSLYQKAITIDPSYTVAYNDLGVVYEAMGELARAEESYLKAIKIDPGYSSAYTNLALLYENQRNLEKAEFYWDKRAQIGSADDPWTQKAASRLKDIRLVLSKQPISDLREQEVLGLMKDVSVSKSAANKDDKALAKKHFQKAKESFNKGDLATAIKEALDAQYLDKDNSEIEAFIEKTELRALSR